MEIVFQQRETPNLKKDTRMEVIVNVKGVGLVMIIAVNVCFIKKLQIEFFFTFLKKFLFLLKNIKENLLMLSKY